MVKHTMERYSECDSNGDHNINLSKYDVNVFKSNV